MSEEDYEKHHIDILTKLWRRGLFGGKYQPVEQVLSNTPRQHHEQAREALHELHKDGLVQYHKNGNCASINPSRKERVRAVLDGNIPDYVLDLH